MPRRTANYLVTDDGRDNGKHFLITEMSASHAESWATRILLALIGANVGIPDNFAELGVAGLAELGMRALGGLKWEVAEPLLAEMMDCVQFMPDPGKPHVARPLIETDIEEVLTRFKLRMEVWSLLTDFLKAVAPSFSPAKPEKPAAADSKRVTRMSAK